MLEELLQKFLTESSARRFSSLDIQQGILVNYGKFFELYDVNAACLNSKNLQKTGRLVEIYTEYAKVGIL